MFTVAYLANSFPEAVEPYVAEEIQELRRRVVRVIPCTVRRASGEPARLETANNENKILSLQPIRILIGLQASLFLLRGWKAMACLLRVLLSRKESPQRRIRALLHTWLGAYYAVQLREFGVDHIHVHHGYFASWIAMVAAKLLGVRYSLTLHGSDLLLNGAYLETKLQNCCFCVTISEYNRRYILEHFPSIDPAKVSVSRLGVDIPQDSRSPPRTAGGVARTLTLLAVGRLHAVKDHAFLVRACARLCDRGLKFECLIAGEGPERIRLESLIQQNKMQKRIKLLGHVNRSQIDSLYRWADVVVLTSRSEGIPLVLMEAMARGRIVVAPAITGVPELVIPGKTGFLYEPGALQDFIDRILFLQGLIRDAEGFALGRLDWIRHAARIQVLHNFNRSVNISDFGRRFLLNASAS